MDWHEGGLIISNNNKEKLTKEDLLLIHLLNYNYHRDRYVVTELITEQGIQSVIACDLSLISRLLSKNEKKEYIYRKLLKIKNKKRKMCAFFLTERGEKIAKELTKLNLNHD